MQVMRSRLPWGCRCCGVASHRRITLYFGSTCIRCRSHGRRLCIIAKQGRASVAGNAVSRLCAFSVMSQGGAGLITSENKGARTTHFPISHLHDFRTCWMPLPLWDKMIRTDGLSRAAQCHWPAIHCDLPQQWCELAPVIGLHQAPGLSLPSGFTRRVTRCGISVFMLADILICFCCSICALAFPGRPRMVVQYAREVTFVEPGSLQAAEGRPADVPALDRSQSFRAVRHKRPAPPWYSTGRHARCGTCSQQPPHRRLLPPRKAPDHLQRPPRQTTVSLPAGCPCSNSIGFLRESRFRLGAEAVLGRPGSVLAGLRVLEAACAAVQEHHLPLPVLARLHRCGLDRRPAHSCPVHWR